jgi:hypothetical protein
MADRIRIPDAIDDAEVENVRYRASLNSPALRRIKADLEKAGWTIDETTYEPRPKSDADDKFEA